MTQAGLQPLRGGCLGAMAADALRSAIYAGRFKPGDPLREMQLARDLRVSQTTVREALLQLEHAGLVVREANRGTRITRLTDEDVRERVTVRIVLETTAAVEAAARLTAGDFAWLDNCRKQLAAAIRRNAYYEAAQADLAFHRLIWAASGNQTLCRILDDLTAPLFAFLSVRYSEMLADLPRRVASHDPIFEALKSRKSTAIRAALREHLAGTYLKRNADADEKIHKVR